MDLTRNPRFSSAHSANRDANEVAAFVVIRRLVNGFIGRLKTNTYYFKLLEMNRFKADW